MHCLLGVESAQSKGLLTTLVSLVQQQLPVVTVALSVEQVLVLAKELLLPEGRALIVGYL